MAELSEKAGDTMQLRTDLGGFLVLVTGAVGLIIILVGELPLPTTAGCITLTGFHARIGGLGLLGLAASFYGVFHHTESARMFFFDRVFCVWGGRALFIVCWMDVGHGLLEELG